MDKSILASLIPILGIIMGCGIPMLAIYIDYRKRREIFRLHHQERMAALEKGLELPQLPDSFFNDGKQQRPRSPHADLGWGLFWLLGGAALFAALYIHRDPKIALYALIPVAIGLHYLIFYGLVGRKEALAAEKDLSPPNEA